MKRSCFRAQVHDETYLDAVSHKPGILVGYMYVFVTANESSPGKGLVLLPTGFSWSNMTHTNVRFHFLADAIC